MKQRFYINAILNVMNSPNEEELTLFIEVFRILSLIKFVVAKTVLMLVGKLSGLIQLILRRWIITATLKQRVYFCKVYQYKST